MKWIDEMFRNMEKDKAAESARIGAKATKGDRTKKGVKKRIPGVLNAWRALISSITNDVNEFNTHKDRAGQTAACMNQAPSKCEVYLPGMQSKRMVLTLEDNDLQVTVHPDFPEQKLTITIETDTQAQHSFWVLGDATKEHAPLSVQQLSEYLLKPIFACADID